MLNKQRISVIIPALNEEQAIARVIHDLPSCIDEVIVVDNGSTDQTAKVAKQAGAQVAFAAAKGYGNACQVGIHAASGDVLAFIDGDYSDYPRDLYPLLHQVVNEGADLAIGVRDAKSCQSTVTNQQDGTAAPLQPAMPWHQRVGNWVLCCLITLLYGTQVSDLGPMRCIGRADLNTLNMSDPNYGWTAEMQLKAVKQGLRIAELPVRYRARIGTSKISGTLKGTVLAGYKILYWTLRLALYKPQQSKVS